MNRFRAYIKPFDGGGAYQADWTEVTDDVDWTSIGRLSQQLDNSEYDIGIFRNASVGVVLRNEAGLYSDVDEPRSIFLFKRANSLFKITRSTMPEGPYCGNVVCGSFNTSVETELFIGMITDEDVKLNVNDSTIKLTVLGLESIYSQIVYPAGADGGLVEPKAANLIAVLLNAEEALELLSVPTQPPFGSSSTTGLAVGYNATISDFSTFENQDIKTVLNQLLQVSNSVIVVEGSALTVRARTPGSSVVATFRGQGTVDGVENIIDISEFRGGLQRVVNAVTFTADSGDVTVGSALSQERYGLRRKELDFPFIGTDAQRSAVGLALLAEFAAPKRELEIVVPLDYTTQEIVVLDRVSVDYPRVYYPIAGSVLPICGVAVCGSAVLPAARWDLTINSSTSWKVMRKQIKLQDGTVGLALREI